jgi:DNA oxidative demethylase
MQNGFALYPALLDRAAQTALLEAVLAAESQAPFYQPTMPRNGTPFSVKMTNMGPLGWVSDRDGGYRYQATHPVTALPWPDMPAALLAIWEKVSGYPHPPQACLVNLYRDGAKMGLHVDASEQAKDAPVVSISLGDTAIFRLGGPQRGGKTASFRLASGDVMVLGGAARHFYHGIDRVLAGSSTLIEGGGRINLTMRVVNTHIPQSDRESSQSFHKGPASL